jgi:hypothetical protein
VLTGSSLAEFLGSTKQSHQSSSSGDSENDGHRQYGFRNIVQNKASLIDRMSTDEDKGKPQLFRDPSNPNE